MLQQASKAKKKKKSQNDRGHDLVATEFTFCLHISSSLKTDIVYENISKCLCIICLPLITGPEQTKKDSFSQITY